MQVFNLPQAFDNQSYSWTTHDNKLRIVFYQVKNETKKASVLLSCNLMIFVLQGKKELHHETGKISITTGEGVFLKEGSYLMTEKFLEKQGYQAILFFFETNFINTIAKELLSISPSYPDITEKALKINRTPLLLPFLHSLYSYQETDSIYNKDLLLKIKLQELFTILTDNVNPAFPGFLKKLYNQTTSKLGTVVEQHFKENLTLEQYAFLSGSSLSSFKRNFQKNYHTSPMKWIQERRLQEAYDLLKTSQKNVSEVCFEVGFENLSHFIQLFKSKFKITPKQLQSELHTT